MKEILNKYGWSFNDNKIFNRLGKKVMTFEFKRQRYYFYDNLNNKLGSGTLGVLEIILKEYYYCKPINNL